MHLSKSWKGSATVLLAALLLPGCNSGAPVAAVSTSPIPSPSATPTPEQLGAYTTVGLRVSPKEITFGRTIDIRGVLRSAGRALGGEEIRLQARASGLDWYSVETKRTRPDGSVNFSLRPSKTRAYRLRYLGDDTHRESISSAERVGVHPRVTFFLSDSSITDGRYVRWHGRVSGLPSGRHVKLQRLGDGAWRTVDSARIKADGSYSGRFYPNSAGDRRLRVFFPKQDSDYLVGHSDSRVLDVNEKSGGSNCDPNYTGQCLDPNAYDYDCAGGSGDGPKYVYGVVRVVGNDHYELDADNDGYGCED